MKKWTIFAALGIMFSSVVYSQNIDLRGIVRNQAGIGIAGAEVILKGRGLKDTTDTQGFFRIFNSASSTRQSPGHLNMVNAVFVTGKGILLSQSSPGPIRLQIFNVAGKIVVSKDVNLDAGVWLVNPGRLNPGTYLGKLETLEGRQSFRFVIINPQAQRDFIMPVLLRDESISLHKSVADVDSIQAGKSPYRTTVVGISSLVDSNIVIALDSASTVSTGCGKTITRPDPGARLTLQVSGTNRTYQLFIPTTYSPNTSLPVIFAFHGGGGSGAAARTDFKLEAAVNNGAILVYPDNCTNYGSGNDVAFFDAMVKDIESKYCIDTRRIFVTGFSMGGIFVNGLGCLRGGSVVRGIIPVAGSGPNPNMGPASEADIACPSGTPTGDVPTMVIHGTADANAAYKYGQWEANYWRKWNGCSATTTAAPSPLTGVVSYTGGRVPVYFYTHSGGHMVPSNAAMYIWEFIKSLK